MSECGKASLIMPLLLQNWLQDEHVQPQYKFWMKKQFPEMDKVSCWDILILSFADLAQSNAAICSTINTGWQEGELEHLIQLG